ncbi:hypothetical protein [Micrococcus luteus]|uniref:hypothetical protein n=1 Tax=Micrococcus luteus TaxID=1270 RepID=UPI001E413AD2|nr:hypothetical protein [Micrococcus luteus]MCD0181638.1 hypothetical protein [Micrococcus luteus]
MSTETTDNPQGHEDAVQAPEPAEREKAPETGNREAAKYRTRLRETEAERDTVRGQLDAAHATVERLQRALVETTAASDLVDPADLWRHGGVEVSELLADDGTPDPEKVSAVVSDILAERRHLARPRTPRPDMTQGGTGTPPPPADPVAAFLTDRLS